MEEAIPASGGEPPVTRRGQILVVDDEPLKRITLQIELSEQGYEVFEAMDAQTACRILDSEPIDVVVSDVRMPGMGGLDLLTHVKRTRPETAVVLMTAYATVDTAVLAIKRGAYDYITKPFTTQDLLVKLDQFFAGRSRSEHHRDVESCGRMIARSQSMKRLFERLRAVAGTRRTLLICGEVGTGKELAAATVHALGPWAAQPLQVLSGVTRDAAALDTELTVALRDGATGTLFLDDIDELSPETQVRLLRVIEKREADSPTEQSETPGGPRLICATKRDLLQQVQQNAFRPDLYYRLNGLSVALTPLRQRPDDIPALANHFLSKHAALASGRRVTLGPHAVDELMRHSWPGNVRELEHVIERALAFCDGDEIRPEHILPLAGPSRENIAAPSIELADPGKLGLTETMADIERRMILLALRQCNGNQARAAQRLGIPRTTLRDKMAKYNIPGT